MMRRANILDHARTILIGELALGLSVMAVPASAQTARVDMQGSVAPRCYGRAVDAIEIGHDLPELSEVSRRVTVRCSGNSPALSVRSQSLANPDVTLTAFGAGGRSGTATEASPMAPVDLGARLAADEGNVLVHIADVRLASEQSAHAGQGGAVEIIVAPAP
ncbi:hypothetical protein [Allosphingosinicella vermicomposti]|uniref:hypothetical protein n=1 Tax=Allosphingosinicella vermicomposti TaxID=614671 RepID=UPI00131A5E4D|nr:hypothetical protein [Allosphingosinicella vermicomposti]